ncbi:MAG: hydroxyethylthiazole kinase [Desulfoplanes sp.]
MITPEQVWQTVEAIRTHNPLVINITNNVVTNTTANALLALGASPAMSHAVEEMDELPALGNALVLNIGTPERSYIESMFKACATATRCNIPIVLDPVAAGITKLRMDICTHLLDSFSMAVIRGNASEIMALAGEKSLSKGADSTNTSNEAIDAGKLLARQRKTIISISGAHDYITNGEDVLTIDNGHPMMPRITGLGCTATAITGACVGVCSDHLLAAADAMAIMGICGEMAARDAQGPGTLQLHFYDALYNLDRASVQAMLRTHG